MELAPDELVFNGEQESAPRLQLQLVRACVCGRGGSSLPSTKLPLDYILYPSSFRTRVVFPTFLSPAYGLAVAGPPRDVTAAMLLTNTTPHGAIFKVSRVLSCRYLSASASASASRSLSSSRVNRLIMW